MPSIRPSSDLGNKYNEVSEFYHKYAEPIFITKNGQGDLAVMSIETFERLVGKFELYKMLGEGLTDVKEGRLIPAEKTFRQIEDSFNSTLLKSILSHKNRAYTLSRF